MLEVAYVSAPQASLRDQVAAIYNRVGNVKNGERVEILDRDRRFARVRTSNGIEGWIEQRFLVDQKTFDGLQKLSQDNQNDPVQAPGVLRNETNLHITPGRETEHLYQLAAGAKVAILKRDTAEKSPAAPVSKPVSGKPARAPAGPVLEDWWLVRDEHGRVGWVLSRMVDVDVPLDIAQYAEGQRFVAFFELDEVADGEKKVPQYLCLLTDPHDGLPYDYDQLRVFTWNVRKHRYETAYREHGLNGVLPVTLTQEQFDKEGTLPVFILRVKNDAGNVVERKYKLNTPIVRRVLAPGELAARPPRTEQTQTLTITHTLWAMFGLLPAGQTQRPHRHQSVALDLILDAPPGCHTLLGDRLDDRGEIIDPVRVDWISGGAFITPPGKWHAHVNPTETHARLIPIQDAGLHTYLRSLDIRFSDRR